MKACRVAAVAYASITQTYNEMALRQRVTMPNMLSDDELQAQKNCGYFQINTIFFCFLFCEKK